MRGSRTAGWALTFALLALAPAAATAEQGIVLRRKITGDEPIVPPSGSNAAAPRGPPWMEEVPLGAEISVWLAPQMGRVDEPSWSLILRLDQGRTYLLRHADRAYSELRYPVKPKRLWGSLRARVTREGAGELFELRAHTPPVAKDATMNGQPVTEWRLTFGDAFGRAYGRRNEVTVVLMAHPVLGRVAFELETLRQRVPAGGESWLSLTGATDGILLSRQSTAYGVDEPFRRNEELIGWEAQEIPGDHFVVPAGYREVRYDPDCR